MHMGEQKVPARAASHDKKVALVLQGGGALGGYQAGVYEALSRSQYLPDWVAGTSIGGHAGMMSAASRPIRYCCWNAVTQFGGCSTRLAVSRTWSPIFCLRAARRTPCSPSPRPGK